MSLSERVTAADVCGLQRRWLLAPTLVGMLLSLEAWAAQRLSPAGIRWPGLFVISGWRRTPILPDLNPGQPPAKDSRHLPCPALAVDLRVGNAPASVTPIELWTALGLHWERLGGRWGGRFSPPDPNHFDIDPALVGGGF